MFNSVYVELTAACNMSCDFCPNAVMERPRGHMKFETFTAIIDEIASKGYTKLIRLAAIGESLLHPRLLDAVEYCRDKGLESSMITNSLVLTTDLYRKLVDSGLGELVISLHDLSEDSFVYRHARGAPNFSAFFENVIRVLDFHVANNMRARMVICLMAGKDQWISSQLWKLPAVMENTRNIRERLPILLEAVESIARRYDLPCLLTMDAVERAIQGLQIFDSRHLGMVRNVVLNIVSLNPQSFNTRKMLEGEAGKTIKLVPRTRGSCPVLVEGPMILANGSLIPCCVDGLEELVVGRVDAAHSICSILEGDAYRRLIDGFRRREIVHPVCQECRGELVYRDPVMRLRHSFASINPQTVIHTFRRASSRFLLQRLWMKLPESPKNLVRRLLRKTDGEQ